MKVDHHDDGTSVLTLPAADRQQIAHDHSGAFLFMAGYVGQVSIVEACRIPPPAVEPGTIDLFGVAS